MRAGTSAGGRCVCCGHGRFLPRPFVSFFFHDPATTEIYTLSLHDALPIFSGWRMPRVVTEGLPRRIPPPFIGGRGDRKSTRLNSSHLGISYAVFCLKKKKRTGRRAPARRALTAHDARDVGAERPPNRPRRS